MSRKEEIVEEPEAYGPSLGTDEVAIVLGCSHRKVWQMQQRGIIKAFPLDPTSQKKIYKTNKSDLITHMLKTEGEEDD